MSTRLRKTLVYCFFVGAVIWGFFTLRDGKQEVVVEPSPTIQPLAPETPPGCNMPLINIEEREAEPWGNDPFRSWKRHRTGTVTHHDQHQSQSWILSGILYNKDNPLAYINWQAVRVGDTIDGARVVAIHRREVTLEQNGNRFIISISKG